MRGAMETETPYRKAVPQTWSTGPGDEDLQVTICGGGNAAHLLAGLLSTRPGLRVNVYAPYGDEAQRMRQGIARRGGIVVVAAEERWVGRPHRVSADPSQVVPGSRLVMLALPAFAHEIVLRDIAPYLDEGAWVGALPARGGFDWCAFDVLGEKGSSLILFGLQTLPWACRLRTYGEEVALLGTKKRVDLATWPPHYAGKVARRLSDLLGVRLQPIPNFLSITLANTGQLIHPGVMYGMFRDWDGHPYAKAPLFYQAVDGSTAQILQRLSDEVQTLREVLEHRFPHLDLSAVRPLDEWLRESYRDAIADPSTLQSCLVTNRSYAGLNVPMRRADEGLVPDFRARYLSEDVPYGLVVTRGIAELAGVATPTMDQVIGWAQARLAREYLVNGHLQGRDLEASRAPQRYHLETLEAVVKGQEEVSSPVLPAVRVPVRA